MVRCAAHVQQDFFRCLQDLTDVVGHLPSHLIDPVLRLLQGGDISPPQAADDRQDGDDAAA
jgi:hypothetical protein